MRLTDVKFQTRTLVSQARVVRRALLSLKANPASYVNTLKGKELGRRTYSQHKKVLEGLSVSEINTVYAT